MKGFVETPPRVTQRMVELLFEDSDPSKKDRILFPGVGRGPFIEAVRDYCSAQGLSFPSGYACDTHTDRLSTTCERYSDLPIEFEKSDFLNQDHDLGTFDYIIGNPPYVPITEIAEERKESYRSQFDTATGRFDLYLLFFERSLDLLAEGGRLVFITPEKYEYTETGGALRQKLSSYHLERLEHLSEDPFPSYITYPTISAVRNEPPNGTVVVPRNGDTRNVTLPFDGTRWSQLVRDIDPSLESTGVTLEDITDRISPGMATGADSVFVFKESDLPTDLRRWSRPTISGRELEAQPTTKQVTTTSRLLCPYEASGDLIDEDDLGTFGNWLDNLHRQRLEERSCCQKNKRKWYAWHENPPMKDLLRDKILFRDITDDPKFWRDTAGDIIPRHSVYYLTPQEHVDLAELQEYLNSVQVKVWLQATCDKARNGYLRLQSKVLGDLPVPNKFADNYELKLEGAQDRELTDNSKRNASEKSDDD